MSNSKWIGTALGLALCSAALTGCHVNDRSSQEGGGGNASGASVDVQWKSDTEKQLRDAIAEAPANGLKPELFLKGGEKGAALTDAALKYASALANGYSDPNQLHEVYTIPHAKVDVRQGLAGAIQKGDVKSWLASLVLGLAQAIYDERAFDRLPILADALEDAGCTDAAILEHCRGPGPHVRGCWVVDLLLGKQ